MRYIHFLDSVDLKLGGLTSAALSICKHLQLAGADTFLITRKRLPHVQEWTEQNNSAPTLIELPQQQASSAWLSLAEQQYVREWLQPGDVVHLHGLWERSSHQVAKICREQNVPYCITPHGMLDHWSMSQKWLKKRVVWSLMGKKYFRGAFAIHSTAAVEEQQIKHWVPNTPIHVIPCILELDSFENLPGPEQASQKFDIKDDEQVILLLSRLLPTKGVEILIESMQRIRKQFPLARILLAGPSAPEYITKIEKLIRERGLNDCVKLLGAVHGKDKVSLYQRTDIFALPTSHENFGLVTPEAMACGTPVITTQGTAIWRELQQGGALIVDRTVEAFAQSLTELLQDPEQRKVLGARGRKWVFDVLNPTEVIKQFLEMYAVGLNTSQGGNSSYPE